MVNETDRMATGDSTEAGGKVDKANPTQFGRAMAQLGIEMIPAYSPEARGRSEQAFRTHQDRLVRELNAEFAQPPREPGSTFVACRDRGILGAGHELPMAHAKTRLTSTTSTAL